MEQVQPGARSSLGSVVEEVLKVPTHKESHRAFLGGGGGRVPNQVDVAWGVRGCLT